MFSTPYYSSTYNIFNLILLFLYIVDPLGYGYIFGILLILIILHKKTFLRSLESNMGLLLIFSICYSIFYIFNLDLGVQFTFIYALFPTGFYLIGKSFYPTKLSEQDLFTFFFVIGLIFSLPAMVSIISVIIDKGFVVVEREVPFIFSGVKVSATNMAAYFVLNMSIPAFLVANFKKFSTSYKLVLGITFIVSILCVLRLGSRTQLSICFITFFISLVYLIRRQTLKQNFSLFGVLFIVTSMVLSYIPLNKDSDLMSAFAGRMESKTNGASTAGGRTERWEKSIVNLWEEPLGWQVTDFGFSHNLWFDVARVAGTLTFFLLLVFTIRNAILIKNTIKLNKNTVLINTLFLCYGLSFYLLFFVEPIFDGYFSVFILYCFYLGIIYQFNSINTINR